VACNMLYSKIVSSQKWPIMCRAGCWTLLTRSLTEKRQPQLLLIINASNMAHPQFRYAAYSLCLWVHFCSIFDAFEILIVFCTTCCIGLRNEGWKTVPQLLFLQILVVKTCNSHSLQYCDTHKNCFFFNLRFVLWVPKPTDCQLSIYQLGW